MSGSILDRVMRADEELRGLTVEQAEEIARLRKDRHEWCDALRQCATAAQVTTPADDDDPRGLAMNVCDVLNQISDADQAASEVARAVWAGAGLDPSEAPDGNTNTIADQAESAVARLRAERDAMRAIVEGRTKPPTGEEIAAHADAGGAWLVTIPAVRNIRHAAETRYTSDPKEVSRLWWTDGARWVAVRNGRPCAWPVVPEAQKGGAR